MEADGNVYFHRRSLQESNEPVRQLTRDILFEKLALADTLAAGRERMLEPQDLPGRYGRVVRALDRLLQLTGSEAVVGGGWAVWRHGYLGRITHDIDIVVPAEKVEELLQTASVSGFRILPQPEGRWPKMVHKETDITVDILPEGARPGTPNNLAPTTIGHPSTMGPVPGRLTYIQLVSLIELKLAAGRGQDEADVIQLIRANRQRCDEVKRHLEDVHASYVEKFDALIARADEEQEED